MDYFSLLGLPRSLVVDADLLQANYYERARTQHPDRHAGDSADATQATAALNNAYRVLRDPITRARYWLELEGEPLRDKDNGVPKGVADLCFEIHGLMDEARASADQEVLQRLQRRHTMLSTNRQALGAALEQNFGKWNLERENRATIAGELRALLLEHTYVEKLIQDVEGVLRCR